MSTDAFGSAMRPEFASRYSTDGFGGSGEMLIDPPLDTMKCKIVWRDVRKGVRQ